MRKIKEPANQSIHSPNKLERAKGCINNEQEKNKWRTGIQLQKCEYFDDEVIDPQRVVKRSQEHLKCKQILNGVLQAVIVVLNCLNASQRSPFFNTIGFILGIKEMFIKKKSIFQHSVSQRKLPLLQKTLRNSSKRGSSLLTSIVNQRNSKTFSPQFSSSNNTLKLIQQQQISTNYEQNQQSQCIQQTPPQTQPFHHLIQSHHTLNPFNLQSPSSSFHRDSMKFNSASEQQQHLLIIPNLPKSTPSEQLPITLKKVSNQLKRSEKKLADYERGSCSIAFLKELNYQYVQYLMNLIPLMAIGTTNEQILRSMLFSQILRGVFLLDALIAIQRVEFSHKYSIAAKYNLSQNALRFVLITLTLLIMLSSCIYAGLELSDYLWDSIWLISVSITTIGYGDIVPVTLLGRALVILVSNLGVVFIAFITSLIQSTQEFSKSDQDEFDKVFLRSVIEKSIFEPGARVIQYHYRFSSQMYSQKIKCKVAQKFNARLIKNECLNTIREFYGQQQKTSQLFFDKIQIVHSSLLSSFSFKIDEQSQIFPKSPNMKTQNDSIAKGTISQESFLLPPLISDLNGRNLSCKTNNDTPSQLQHSTFSARIAAYPQQKYSFSKKYDLQPFQQQLDKFEINHSQIFLLTQELFPDIFGNPHCSGLQRLPSQTISKASPFIQETPKQVIQSSTSQENASPSGLLMTFKGNSTTQKNSAFSTPVQIVPKPFTLTDQATYFGTTQQIEAYSCQTSNKKEPSPNIIEPSPDIINHKNSSEARILSMSFKKSNPPSSFSENNIHTFTDALYASQGRLKENSGSQSQHKSGVRNFNDEYFPSHIASPPLELPDDAGFNFDQSLDKSSDGNVSPFIFKYGILKKVSLASLDINRTNKISKNE